MENNTPTHMLSMVIGLAAAAWMAGWNYRSRTYVMAYLMLFLLLVPIVLQLVVGELRNPWRAFEMATYVASAWLIYRMAGTRGGVLLASREWCVLVGLVGNISAVFTIAQMFNVPFISGSDLFPVWEKMPGSSHGLLGQANLQGLLMVLICIPLWSRGLTEDKRYPWWLASLLPCSLIWETSSRGSALVLVTAALLLLWMSRQRFVAFVGIVGVICLSGVLNMYWQIPSQLTGYEATLIDRIASVGIEARLFIWDMSLRLFLEHPWLGIGAGNFMAYGAEAAAHTLGAHPEFASVASSMTGYHFAAHNLILQFFLEWGLLGGLFVVTLIVLVTRRLWSMVITRDIGLCEAKAQGGIGLGMMLLHGMFSVSMLTGFFLVLLALYAAALFPSPSWKVITPGVNWSRFILLLVPSVLMLFNWHFFISREWRMEQMGRASLSSEEFIQTVSSAIDNPWTSRVAIEWYLGRLLFERDYQKFIQSERFIYQNWLMQQSARSLRNLILLAHLKGDAYAERRWVGLFRAAYPLHGAADGLKAHVQSGHNKGEAIDLRL